METLEQFTKGMFIHYLQVVNDRHFGCKKSVSYVRG